MDSRKITQEIKAEIDKLEQAIGDWLGQRISDSRFRRIRLQHGVYGQRQEGVHMIRIKIPQGGLSAEQFETLADVCQEYSRGIAHITTRQAIQIHYVTLARVPELMRRLARAGITTREACGNTVRNVTACPYSGVSKTEPFDVTPYAKATTDHLLRNPICQNMGRKFKIAFEGCHEDHTRLRIHDIGLKACIKEGKRGFQVFTSGGLGSGPRIADLFYDFMPEEELIPFCEAIIRFFDRYGERKIRQKARMKFLVEKFGFEKFKEMVEAERRSLKVDSAWNDYLKAANEPVKIPAHPASGEKAEEAVEYLAWRQTNARPQQQEGYSIVELRCVNGNMVPDQMRTLAALTRKYADGNILISIEQNLFLRWVHNEDLPALYHGLAKIDMALPNAGTLFDITACPGIDTCRLGITSSMSLAVVLEKWLAEENGVVSQYADDLRIKISGCPNSCAHHHLGNIGFHGAALPQEDHTLPAFQLLLGGGVKPDETTIGKLTVKIPSKNVPEATVRLIKHFSEDRQDGEEFNDYYGRIGRSAVEKLLADLCIEPSYDEKPEFYTDWDAEREFRLQHGVVGECAGSPVEDVAPQLTDAEPVLEQARALLPHGEYASVIHKAYEAIAKAADVLLYTRAVQTFEPRESVFAFENHFVRTGEISELTGFEEKVNALMAATPTQESAQAILTQAETIYSICKDKLA